MRADGKWDLTRRLKG